MIETADIQGKMRINVFKRRHLYANVKQKQEDYRGQEVHRYTLFMAGRKEKTLDVRSRWREIERKSRACFVSKQNGIYREALDI